MAKPDPKDLKRAREIYEREKPFTGAHGTLEKKIVRVVAEALAEGRGAEAKSDG